MDKTEQIPWVKLTLCIGLGIISVAASFMYRPSSELITVTTECDPCQKVPSAEKVVVVPLPSRLHPEPPSVYESEPTLLYQALLWFDEGASNVDTNSFQTKKVLQKLAEITKYHLGTAIQLDGHTDQCGSAKFNQELSKKRGENVKLF
ncbi:MAG: hypothetical protein D3916_16240, partial [Candidatus Electrothrix sp. MAN1_4]|nr:hypothetical protein [Candidatus Electrothrix sp. MAN1_4]